MANPLSYAWEFGYHPLVAPEAKNVQPSPSTTGHEGTELPPAEAGHPRGTLAIVVIFGLLFALGWIAMYVFRFLGRGAPHP